MKSIVRSIIFVLLLNNFRVLTLDNSKWNLENIQKLKSLDAAVIQYYEKKTSMISISVSMQYSQLWQTQIQDYLLEALLNSKLMKYQIFINTANHWQPVTKVSDHNLWYVDSFKAFRLLLRAVEVDSSDKMGKYAVIMDTAGALNQKQEVNLILEQFFHLNIVDVFVAVYEGNATFILYSYDMFKPHHCWQAVVEQVNVFQNGQFQYEQLFPYKLNNFHSCPLIMYIRNSSLFYRYNLTQDGTQIASIEGLEANMIQTIANKLNFQFHMFYSEEDDSIGTVFENGTVVGTFRYLFDHKFDVLLGYYHYPARHRYFGESTSYAFMPLVIVLNKSHRSDLTHLWPFKPFTAMTWLAFGLLSLFVVIIVQFLHYYLGKTVTWIDVVGLALNNARPVRLNMFMIKVSFVFCIFGIMILCATFQGRLYYAFNRDYIYRITTVQQMIQANYTFLVTRRFDSDIIRSLHIPFEQIHYVNATDDFWIYDTIRQYPGNAATFTNYWDFQMYMDSKKYYNQLDILPLTVILNQICAYTRKHSYLIDPFNRAIKSLKYSGILNKWLNELSDAGLTDEMNSGTKQPLTRTPQSLSTKKFQIIFTALISLYLISVLAFLGELITKNWENILQSCRKIINLKTHRQQTSMKN